MNRELTKLQRKILKMLAEGEGSKEIGDALGTAKRTVDNHCVIIMVKLGAKNRPHAVALAIREGLI